MFPFFCGDQYQSAEAIKGVQRSSDMVRVGGLLVHVNPNLAELSTISEVSNNGGK
jgi:hypothetical protein